MTQEAEGSAPPRVLIADPQASFRNAVADVLRSRGYVVETCEEGLECLDKAGTFQPNVVVVDLVLPGIHGIDILTFLHNNPDTVSVKLIACSGKIFRPEIKSVQELGAIFIPKPVKPEGIADRVDQMMGRAVVSPISTNSLLGTPDVEDCFRPTLSRPDCYIKFWGTRGSVPVSGKPYIVHGGNTSCVEVRSGEDIVILDAGTGIRPLGGELLREQHRRIHLFVTHTHWDHIQGFPFFGPAFLSGFNITVYGASGFGKDLHGIFQGQLDKDYFPIQLEDFMAKIEFQILQDRSVRIGDMKVSWEFTNHPGAAVGYRVDLHGRSIAYVSDNEFARGYLGAPQILTRDHDLVAPSAALIDLLEGVDLLIHECQYTNEEYPGHIGWGHSSLSNAAQLVKLCRPKRWVVTHHDPTHSDETLDHKLLLTRQVLSDIGYPIEVQHAADGMILRPW
jgi:phosphoribosyl 1,2-cyclic phosphodiesterase/CheY-like chemotaxis protein